MATKIRDNPNYYVAKAVLAKKALFTIDEIRADITDIELTREQIIDILTQFRESGVIVEYGTKYGLVSTIRKG